MIIMNENKRTYVEEELVITLMKTRCNVQKYLVTSTIDKLSIVMFLCDQWDYMTIIMFTENGVPIDKPHDVKYRFDTSFAPETIKEQYAAEQRTEICRVINMSRESVPNRVIYQSVIGRPADSNADTNCPGPIWYDVIFTHDPLEAANLSATVCYVKTAAKFLDDFVEERLTNI